MVKYEKPLKLLVTLGSALMAPLIHSTLFPVLLFENTYAQRIQSRSFFYRKKVYASFVYFPLYCIKFTFIFPIKPMFRWGYIGSKDITLPMYHVVAATTNPAKIEAIKLAFDDIFGKYRCHIEPVDVASGVSLQPIGNAETRTGARQRVMEARQVRPEANFWVGVEAGIEDNMTFAWMTIENSQTRGESRSASLMLPEIVLQKIRAGHELGNEMANITGNHDIRRQQGAIGFFTEGKLSRSSVYHQALLLALAPFHNPIYRHHENNTPNQ